MCNMKLVRVNSSSLASVAYDDDLCMLEVLFRNGGRYQYFAVPHRVFDELLVAPSKGAFVNEHIKPRFPFRRVLHPSTQ